MKSNVVAFSVKPTETSNPGDIPCAAPFTKIGNIPGCYYPAVNEEVTWQEAEDACQALNPRAHLITFDSLEVRYLEEYTVFNT